MEKIVTVNKPWLFTDEVCFYNSSWKL